MSSPQIFIFVLISLTSITSCFSSNHHASTSTPTGFKSGILNKNSVRSPFHNQSLTRFDRIKNSVSLSFSRRDYLHSLLSKNASLNSIESSVWRADGEYVMKYYIGTPAVETYAILDTGSELNWIQCLPCERCYNQSKVPIYNPASSSSYNPLKCEAPRCWQMQYYKCTDNYEYCEYELQYMDTSMSKGVLSEETLQFVNGIENVTMNNIFFGCGHNNSFHNNNGEGIPGLIGLTTKPESLVSQLHYKKFAYCLGDFDDIDARGYAAFGDAAHITGGTTPLADSDLPYYFLNLEAISVENTILPIPKGTFTKTKDISSGFVIDSGSTYSIITRSAFNILLDNLRQKPLYQNTVADPNDSFDLCFKSDAYNLKSAPVITLHFTGLSLQLPFQNTWEKINENIYCLAMLPSDGVSLLGNFQQQNYNVGHDLENRLVSFALMYCSD